MQRADLYIRVDLDEGLHIYGPSVPEGYVATRVDVAGPGLRVGEIRYPPTVPFRVQGLHEQFEVFEGVAEIAVPVISTLREGESTAIDVEVVFQACSAAECYAPRRERLRLDVPLGRLNSARGG